tara:strand:- start:214 stop:480 length:267 start_codon:yes stop_codon:yes gene_type:complete
VDIAVFIEEFGIPISVACAFGYFIWKQNNWIQHDLMGELDESFGRLEAIVIKLIDQSKSTQMDIKELKGYMDAWEDVLKNLTDRDNKR